MKISINSKALIRLMGALLAIGVAQAHAAGTLFQNVTVQSAFNDDAVVTDVLVSGGKVAGIGLGLAANSDTKVIDGSGKTLTYGFFNSSTQLGLVEVGAVANTNDGASENKRITASLKVSDAINPSSVLLPHNRMLGITHALVEPGSDAGLFAGTASIIQLSAGNTMVKKDAAMVVVLGGSAKKISGGSRATTMAVLREAFEDARDYSKNRDSFNRGNRRDYQMSRHDLAALVPVIERRLPLLVHVNRAVDIERIIEFANKNRFKLILSGVEEGWRVSKLIASNKIPVIIDPIFNLPANYNTLGARLDNAKLLNEAGVRLLFTGMSWHNTHNAYLVRQSAGNAVANGLPYRAALAAVTSNPAKVFGLKASGNVKVGAPANLVLWSGDPFEMSTAVEAVLIGGENQPLVSRSTRLRDRYWNKLNAGN